MCFPAVVKKCNIKFLQVITLEIDPVSVSILVEESFNHTGSWVCVDM